MIELEPTRKLADATGRRAGEFPVRLKESCIGALGFVMDADDVLEAEDKRKSNPG